jgi:hypothetical protein
MTMPDNSLMPMARWRVVEAAQKARTFEEKGRRTSARPDCAGLIVLKSVGSACAGAGATEGVSAQKQKLQVHLMTYKLRR